jgi:hypothetical protein
VVAQHVVDDLHVAPRLPGDAAVKAPLDADPWPAVVGVGLAGGGVRGDDPAVPVGRDPRDPLRRGVILDPHDFVIARIVVARKAEVVLPEEVVGDDRPLRVHDRGDVFQREEFTAHEHEARGEPQHAGALGRGGCHGRLGGEQLLVQRRGVAEVALAVGGLGAGVDLVERGAVGGKGGREA